jgi:RND superfamily putative drug exporter
MFELGRWCFRNRRRVLAAWLVTLVLLGVGSQVWGGAFRNDFRVAESESQRALDLLQERFPAFAGDPLALVFRAEDTVDDPDVRRRMEAFFSDVAAMDGVEEVVSPYVGLAPVSPDRRTAIAQVRLSAFGPEVEPALVRSVIDQTEQLSELPGLQVDVGGPTAMFAELEPPGEREAAGVVVALGVLLVTFGSVLAAGLPVAVALGGLGAGMGLVFLLTRVMEVFTFAPAMAAMIGLGVGIDYALFILTRYRQELTGGSSPEVATGIAIGTAGRAVVLAGATVVVSLLGMVMMGVSMVVGMALSAALVVACTVAAAITLLPAVLGFIGPGIDRYGVAWFQPSNDDPSAGRWYRWSRAIQARPWPALLAGLVVLLVLAVPVLGMELGGPHFGAGPESHSNRRAYDLVTDSFGEGFNGPLAVVAEITPGRPADLGVLDGLVQAIGATDGVAMAVPAMANPAGDTAVVTVIPTSAPHSTATQQLVERLRDDVVPAAVGTSGVQVSVSGVTALFADMADLFNRRLPVFIATVIGLSFLLLMVVFRSVLVPLKAAALNLLSIGAAYGVVVAVFQWGWGAGLIGVDQPGPIMAFIPMMLFAILFGLSMDYEVFLLSRIREEYERSGDNATAVADGLAATARVITAAAAIMVIIFSSFVLGDDPIVKTFGLGLAVAVFVDATVVRMVMVPASMELLGDANWWLPAWLERRVPRLDLEGGATAVGPEVPAGATTAPQPVHLRADLVAWLESLTDDERGRAAAHVEHALANGAVTAADWDGSSDVVVPLGRRTRRLLLTPAVDGYVLDVRSGRLSEMEGDWPHIRDRLLQSVSARTSYGQVRRATEVADHLRSLREARDLTVEDVAEQAGITVDVVERLERGDGSVGVIDLIGVGRVLDARIDLTGGDVRTATGTRLGR